MKLLIALILAAISLHAQTGTVTGIAPVAPVSGKPGSFTAVAGVVNCSVTGTAFPATAAIISCAMGAVSIAPYTIPLPAGSAYTFDHRLNGDAVTVILQSSASGAITWQAAATPSGGTAASGNGTL